MEIVEGMYFKGKIIYIYIYKEVQNYFFSMWFTNRLNQPRSIEDENRLDSI